MAEIWRSPTDTPKSDRLRPHLWLGFAADQGRGRCTPRHHHLRSRERRRHLGTGQDEHDSSRQRGRPTSAKVDTHHEPASSRRATSSRPSTSLVANPPFSVSRGSNGARERLRALRVRQPTRQEWRLRLPAPRAEVAQERPARRSHPAAWRAVPGNAEADIRRQLLKRGYIKGVIGLPANLFYGTGIPACILVLDKEDAQSRTGVFMIDASKGFVKDGPKNRLRSQDMHKIVDAFTKQEEIRALLPHGARAPRSPMRRTTTTSTSRAISIRPSPKTSRTCTHTCRAASRTATSTHCSRIGMRSRRCAPLCSSSYVMATPSLAVDKADIQATITDSDEYQAFTDGTAEAVAGWWAKHHGQLEAHRRQDQASRPHRHLSEELLAIFRPRPLIDEYGVYEQLMSYWNESMHDDVAMIVTEGWVQAAKPRKARNGRTRTTRPSTRTLICSSALARTPNVG